MLNVEQLKKVALNIQSCVVEEANCKQSSTLTSIQSTYSLYLIIPIANGGKRYFIYMANEFFL
jgi:hypothetical protein